MLGIDGPELLVIIIVLVVVVKPQDLPAMLRSLGRIVLFFRTTLEEFRNNFETAMHEADMRGTVEDPDHDSKQISTSLSLSEQNTADSDRKACALSSLTLSGPKIFAAGNKGTEEGDNPASDSLDTAGQPQLLQNSRQEKVESGAR